MQTKLISLVNEHNNLLKSLYAKIDNVQTKMKSYDVSFSDSNIKIDSFSTKYKLLIDNNMILFL